MQTNPTLRRRTLWLALSAGLVAALMPILLIDRDMVSAHDQRSSIQHRAALQSAALPVTITVEPKILEKNFAVGAIGLSLETEELSTRDLESSHRSLVALMRLLGPGVLRLGGNSVDRSWWSSNGEASPGWATSVINASDLTRLHRLMTATGWRVILGINLGHFDPGRAANEARAAQRILGNRLLGFEIGNEPDDYGDPRVKLRPSSYSVTDYLGDMASYDAAIRVAAPDVDLYGPDVSLRAWLPAIAANAEVPFSALTQHYYPTAYSVPRGACEGTPVPTAAELLSLQVRERENAALQALVSVGQIAHRPTRLSETNATGSCDTYGGPETSPVFASALWSFDWALRAASTGVVGLNFHGSFGRCGPNTSSPICAPSEMSEARGAVIARPEFYGLLAARQLEGGQFIPAYFHGVNSTGNLTVYATRHARGVVTVAINNVNAEAVSVILQVPGYARATGEALTAPSLTATRGVTFGSRSFDTATGVLRPRITNVSRVGRAFRLKLTPLSAAVITLRR